MKKKLFMLQKLLRDILQLYKRKPVYTLSYNLHNSVLDYPFNFREAEIASGKKQRLISEFDENGIPLIKSYIDVADGNARHYYPITIGQVGLSVYQSYTESKTEHNKQRFLHFVDWFKNHATHDETGTFWLTHVPKPEYKVATPWKSAFSQSRAISILLRGFELTGDKALLKTLEDALKPYTISYNTGGVAVFFKDAAIYEEYVAQEPTMVLDGHIFSLFGPWEIIKLADKLPENLVRLAQDIFEKGIRGLEQTLADYDMGFWLRFNLCRMPDYPKIDPCTIGYMRLIQIQLTLLHKLTDRSIFSEYSEKIARYLTLKNAIKAYQVKLNALKRLNRV
jgi:hypothetical protein